MLPAFATSLLPMTVPIIHHPDFAAPLPVGHRFPMGKYGRLMQILHEDGVVRNANVVEPVSAPLAWIEMVHNASYVRAVVEQTLGAEQERRIGFPVTEAVARRSRLSAGATVLAGRLALEHGIACSTAGGSHHAARAHGAGFCVFNDVAVAARLLVFERTISRVLVVDLDVHQGDGTASIFRDDRSVFTFSMHCESNFPVRKENSNLDVGLPIKTGDEIYLAALGEHLPQLLRDVDPDLVFYNAGVDPHEDDRLGRLSLTDGGIAARENLVLSLCQQAEVPVACVIGGGYQDDIDALARRHSLIHRAAINLFK
jgi:acetoin utilization deacetylase AcuC-like enzyme